ncbi:MAG: hypothetical protein GXP24_05210 [Planctomycetes bacterium]|nr:hypothetical protein [Planctomycetota bacterium]
MPLPRPRFSLLTLLLLMTIVAMATALWKLNSELVPLRQEIANYRQQLGYLTIDESDIDKIHAMKVDSQGPDEWRYRIYLPPGHNYKLGIREGRFPDRSQFPTQSDYLAEVAANSSGSYGDWKPGEFLLSFRIDPDVKDTTQKTWAFKVTRVGEGRKNTFTSTVPWMADKRLWSSHSGMVGNKQKSFEADEPLVLHEVRRAILQVGIGSSYSVKSSQGAADGFLLYIEPMP